jgi:hypothetical protein
MPGGRNVHGDTRFRRRRTQIEGPALRYQRRGAGYFARREPVWYFLRYTTEKHTVERFMHAVVTGDTQQAYQIWHPHPNFSYQDFLSFWGPSGYYSPIKSYRIESAEVPPKGGSGVVIVVEISAYDPFPKPEETVKSAQNREVQLWVERSDQSMSFPPP